MSISPNTSIAQYTIVSKLGEGGMVEAEAIHEVTRTKHKQKYF